jgi:4-hydroxybenzoate polyprenyltransferase
MRLQQWVKNLFLFAALIFGGRLFVLHEFLLTLAGFIAFSLLSSGVYLYNDIIDLEKDKKHPIKCQRPLAAGNLSRTNARVASSVLAVGGLIVGFLLRFEFGVILSLYLLLNIAYSHKIKDLVILDVMSLAAGSVLRVAAGAVLIEVPMSEWLILCTILLSLFLGFSKRRTELVLQTDGTSPTRSVLGHYSPHFLDQMTGIVTATTVMSYALYTISAETVEKFGTHDLIYTVPFVLYGIFRYLYLVHKKAEGEDPTKTILTDAPLLINVAVWIVVASWIIYR